MFKKKKFVGMMVDGEAIKLVRITPRRSQFIVDAVRTVDISELVHAPQRKSAEVVHAGDSDDDVFGLEEMPEHNLSNGKGTEAENDPDSGADNVADTLESDRDELDLDLELDIKDDDWMNTEEPSQADDVKTRVVYELMAQLHELGGKKVNLGMVIPSGRTLFHTIGRPSDINSRKKEKKFISERLEAIFNLTNLTDDQLRWTHPDKDHLLVGTCQEPPLLFELYERMNTIEPQKFFLRAYLPEEVALSLFVDEPEVEHEGSSVLINLGAGGARILFMNKGVIQSAMPMISTKSTGSAYVNKVFSRIMMELEKGHISYVKQFVINDTTGSGHAMVKILSKNFEGIECRILDAGEDIHFDLPEGENTEDVQMSAIGAAIAAAGESTPLSEAMSFIPKSVMDRQKVFKLKWHGVLLLMMIAAVPVIVNEVYQQVRAESATLAHMIDRQTQQINELSQIQQSVQAMDQQISVLSAEFGQIEDLGRRTLLWTETLNILASGLPDIRNTWITSMQYTEDGRMSLEGTTMYRERVPFVAGLFHDAGIQQVTRAEIRNREVFNFLITVNKITDDESRFDPVIEIESGQVNPTKEGAGQ